MLIALIAALALADDPVEEAGEEPIEAAAQPDDLLPPPPPPHLEDATEVEGFTADQHAFLRPKRHLLEQNPYAEVDYTAYSLEWGEVALGLAGIHFGAAPRVQIGTQPIFDLLGIYNISGKANFLRAGPVDLAFLGTYHVLPLGDFLGQYVGAGAMTSLRPTDSWSVHVGGQFIHVAANGFPTQPPALFRAYVTQDEIDQLGNTADQLGVSPSLAANAMFIRFATDYRFNRRDSIVFQFQGLAFGSLNSSLGEMDETQADLVELVLPFAADLERDDNFSLLDAYVFSVSWQFAWQAVRLRMGGGWSADKFTWAIQGNDLNYRFWGKTRLEDRRRKRGWKDSADDVGAADTKAE